MTTKYFILTKPTSANIDDNTENQIVHLNSKKTYLLPEIDIDYYYQNGLFERRLIEWCKQFCRKDKIFLDIGAHTGTYSISLSSLCKEVHAFEPQRMTYYALCGSVALSSCENIYTHPYGLGSEEQVGIQTLQIVSNDGGGSSLHHTKERHHILATEQITIKTLDSMEWKDIGFMKIDVEENELFVLQGAANTLHHNGYPPFIFECNNGIESNPELFRYITQELVILPIGKYQVIPIANCPNMYLATISW